MKDLYRLRGDPLFILPPDQDRHGMFNNLNDGALQLAIALDNSEQIHWNDVDLIALACV